MRTPLCAALLLVACGSAPRQVDTSSQARFAQTIVPLTAGLTTYPVTAKDDPSLVVETGDGPNDLYEINLKSPWKYCQDEPDDCDEGVKRFLAEAFTRLEKAKARGATDEDAP